MTGILWEPLRTSAETLKLGCPDVENITFQTKYPLPLEKYALKPSPTPNDFILKSLSSGYYQG
jgi:hypothetical protein